MNALPFPINPQTGEWFQNWVWNGARWVASPTTGLRVLTRTYTASGPYMPSPGLVACAVECVGGGGGGGGCTIATVGNVIIGGGGGGSGGYSRSTLPAALVRGGVMVTVGAGGAGDATGGAVGANGGMTTFGGLVSANGGLGGSSNPGGGSPWGALGDGAPAGMGDAVFPGACGQSGVTLSTPASSTGVQYTYPSAQGGVSYMGGSRNYLTADQSAHPGADSIDSTGAGGGGALINQMGFTDPQPGGQGGSGICIVTEYCWGDRDQPVTEWRPPLDVNLNVTQRPPWPPRPPGPWWPPGWPPGWQPGSPWPPGWGPRPPWIQPFEGQTIEGQEFEAGVEPYSQDPGEDP